MTLTLASGVPTATITTSRRSTMRRSTAAETVILTLTPNAAYRLGPATSATGTIADNDGTPVVSVAATDARARSR